MFRFLVDNNPAFNINQREGECNRTPIMLARNQPRQNYEELIRLGADAKTLDPLGNTVLHCVFQNRSHDIYPSSDINSFLEGGEILALLIQAGADPLAANRFGDLPQDIFRTSSWFPDKKVEKRIRTAIWHQALKICGLSGSKYCHCPVHHQEKIIQRDGESRLPSRRWERNGLLPYETFEEEMSAALRSWDKSVAQRKNTDNFRSESWNEIYDEHDKWIQKVLIKLQAGRKRLLLRGI